MLPSWFKPLSSLAWIFVVASPYFLYCSPVIFSHRAAEVSLSLLFSESSRASSPFIQSKCQSLCCDPQDLNSLDPLTLLILLLFLFPLALLQPFPILSASGLPMVSCIIINLKWVLDKALMMCNLVEKCESLFLDEVKHGIFYLLCQMEGKRDGHFQEESKGRGRRTWCVQEYNEVADKSGGHNGSVGPWKLGRELKI